MTVISQSCERARGWASLRVDGELSALESALLDAHLGRCLPCRRFARDVEDVAGALRASRVERPAPVALLLPHRRSARRGLHAVAAAALVVAAGAVGALIGVDRHAGVSKAPEPVAIVAAGESPDLLRELRRALLISHGRAVPRNRRAADESA
jgi:predicted anti-sigma-YlaC factor YlaD